MRRVLGVAALAVALAVTGLVPAAAPAAAESSMVLEGRGYGHGRGMSQHGARAHATAGRTWQEILAFYYPGTTRATEADAPIRVWISADTDRDVRVVAQEGLQVASGTTTATLPSGPDHRQWRLERTSSGFRLQHLDRAGTWRTLDTTSLAPAVPLTGTPAFRLPGAQPTLTLVRPDGVSQVLRGGEIRAAAEGATDVRTVAVMPMEDYLRSVVPREMPASWPAHAVRAQAVAARTYAAALRAANAARTYDTCDTISCQVFFGVSQTKAGVTTQGEHALSDGAIEATRGVVLRTGSGYVLAEFSAANGGWTVGSNLPYQVAKADPLDTYTWTRTITSTAVEKAYPAIGTWQGFGTVQRDGNGAWGGRTTSVVVQGSRGSVTVTGDAFRRDLGLQSTWWRPRFAHHDPEKDWSGDGQPDVLAMTRAGALLLSTSDGLGGFGTATQVGSGWQAMDEVAYLHGFAGDGKQGLVARRVSDGSLWFYRAAGGGGFDGAVRIGSGWHVFTSVTPVRDWRFPGDVGLLGRTAGGELFLYPADRRGGFERRIRVGTGWHRMGAVLDAGNFDGTGRPQLVAVEKATGTLWLYPGDGKGGWQARRAIGKGWNAVSEIVGGADWNRDGRDDLLGRVSGTVYLYPGTGAGGFGTRTLLRAETGARLVR
ncbi:MAG: SpoIID/LytB domain-containing protein [Actinotalea sp.]|nr:SpoIID/LytB domain-containing protein [Actinotalea sp.]